MRILNNVIGRLAALLTLTALAVPAFGQANLPPTSVYARAYNGWSLMGQQANTYTFNGAVCNYSPYNNGNSPSFFVFGGTQGGTAVNYPVLIIDPNPALSEIVTPSSTVQGASTCGFAGSPTNAHTSFFLQSGTVGLQEAVATQVQSAPPTDVLLDQFWYQQVFALPGLPTPESLITATKGNTNVAIVDSTTTPWTFWRWNGTAYAAVSLSGGTTLPTAAAGAAAGTAPTGPTNTGDANTYSIALTSGTATTTGVLLTETYATPTAPAPGFTYAPACKVWSSGANVLPSFTYAVTFASSHAVVTVTSVVAPVASTAYALKVVCN